MLEATEITLDRLELWLSEPRLNVYLRAAGDDPWRAYQLYLWNANLAQVLLPMVQEEQRTRIALCHG